MKLKITKTSEVEVEMKEGSSYIEVLIDGDPVFSLWNDGAFILEEANLNDAGFEQES